MTIARNVFEDFCVLLRNSLSDPASRPMNTSDTWTASNEATFSFTNSKVKNVRSVTLGGTSQLLRTDYTVDYFNGDLIFTNPVTGTVVADYDYDSTWIFREYPRLCFTEDLEVLTKGGWKQMSKCDIGEEILAPSSKNLKLEWTPILKKTNEEYEGEVIKLESNVLKTEFTPNHKLLIRTKKHHPIKMIEAKNLKYWHLIPNSGVWVGNDIENITFPSYKNEWKQRNEKVKRSFELPEFKLPIDEFLSILGLYLSEGSLHKRTGYLEISQTNKENLKKIEKLLKQTGLKYGRLTKGGFYLSDKRVGLFFKKFNENCYHKYMPQFVKELSPQKLEILLYWMILGDGSKVSKSKDSWEYYTVSKRLADDVSEIAIKTGRRVRIKKRVFEKSTVPCYVVKLYNRNWKNYNAKRNLKRRVHKGRIYCLTTKMGTLIVKTRNGSVFFSGNSDATMPRISITQLGPAEDVLTIGNSKILYRLRHQVDIWCDYPTSYTISGETFQGPKLRDKLTDDVVEIIKDNRDWIPNVIDSRVVGVSRTLEEIEREKKKMRQLWHSRINVTNDYFYNNT